MTSDEPTADAVRGDGAVAIGSEKGASRATNALQTVHEATRTLMAADSSDRVVETTVAVAGDVLDLPKTGVWLYDQSDGALVPTTSPDGGNQAELPRFERGDGPAWEVFTAGSARLVDGSQAFGDQPSDDLPDRVAIAPLGDHGILIACSSGDAELTDERCEQVAILGTAAETALDRLDGDHRGSVDAMRTLHEATREMVGVTATDEVVEIGLEAAVDVLGLSQTGVHLHDADATALVPVDWSGPLEAELGEPPALGPDSLAWSVYEDGQSVAIDDFWDESGVHNPDTPFRSELIVPLGSHGVALFSSTEPSAFDADDRRFAEVLCSNAAAALDRIQREADLRDRERALERQYELQDRLTDEIEESVEELSRSAADVSGTSQEINALASDQASTMEDVATEISHLSAVVQEIASHAERVRETSDEAATLAEDGHETATEAAGVMEGVEATTVDAADEFEDLQAQVEEIDEIVEVINSIADRTNMLALNASIEAANAGEAGNGFAVVAEEVKSLAEETQEQAGRIETRVESVQSSTDETVAKLQSASEHVQRGLEQVERTMEHFEEIVEAVTDTAEGITEVASATDEQAETSGEVSQMVDESVETAADVSAGIQDIAAANQQQARMVEEVRQSIDSANKQLRDLE